MKQSKGDKRSMRGRDERRDGLERNPSVTKGRRVYGVLAAGQWLIHIKETCQTNG